MFRQIFASAFVIACMSAQGAAIHMQESADLDAADVGPVAVGEPVTPGIGMLADKLKADGPGGNGGKGGNGGRGDKGGRGSGGESGRGGE